MIPLPDIILPDPSLREAAGPRNLLLFLTSVFLHAIFVITLPRTRPLQLILLPFTLWQAWICIFRRDFAGGLAPFLEPFGYEPDRLGYMNLCLAIIVTVQAWRTIEWTLHRKPYQKLNPSIGHMPPTERPLTPWTVYLDAWDLSFNLRGIGWSWSRRPFPPPNKHGFSISLWSLILLNMEWIALDTLHFILQYRQPSFTLAAGDTIFDPTLPPITRFLSACFTTVCSGACIILGLDYSYKCASIVGRVIFREPAWRWPRLFDAPWAATSIADFWTRWHHLFRRQFTFLGSALARALGLGAQANGAGAMIGAFTLSAVLHEIGTWALQPNGGFEPTSVGGFFFMMGVGAVIERAWKPRGMLGWLWTFTWTVGWGTRLVDAWTRRGLLSSMFVPEELRPGKMLVTLVLRAISK